MVAMVLLAKGADVHARDKGQESPLHMSCFRGHIGVAKALIDNGAAIHNRDRWQRTPLHQAYQNGHIELSILLVERGSDIHARDIYGSAASKHAYIRDAFEKLWCTTELMRAMVTEDKATFQGLLQDETYNVNENVHVAIGEGW